MSGVLLVHYLLEGPAKGVFFYLYLMMDIYSRKAHQPAAGLHSDNGSPMKASTMTVKLLDLGINTSYSRPRFSNDNPYSEALFRTCKYRPDFPRKGFETLLQARKWVAKFIDWYNHDHRHSALKFVTPSERHSGKVTHSWKDAQTSVNKRKETIQNAGAVRSETGRK